MIASCIAVWPKHQRRHAAGFQLNFDWKFLLLAPVTEYSEWLSLELATLMGRMQNDVNAGC